MSSRVTLRDNPGVGLVMVCVCFTQLTATALGQDPSLIQPYQLYQAAKADKDYPAAADYGRQVLAAAQAQSGVGSAELIGPLQRLGEVLVLADQLEPAADYYRRALGLQETALGPDHPDLIPTLDALASIAIAQQDYVAAERQLRRILAIERAVYGEKHAQVIVTLERLRDLFVRQGDATKIAAVDAEIEAAKFAERSLSFGDDGGRRYSPQDGYATVRVFYGTNRARTGDAKPATFYGADRGQLDLGHLDVTIPETHKYGELESESRFSLYTYVLGEQGRKKRYVLLQDVTPLGTDDFYSRLREYVGESPSNDVFLFVHGYNSSFEDAARRAAQLAYDLDFDGTPMMYSWPSQGSTAAYTVDEAVVRLSGQKMSRFLENVVAQSGAERIHLIAHSMGNRAMIEALQSYMARQEPGQRRKTFDQIIFTAPDVDRDYFVEVIEGISQIAERVTLYASDNDVALRSSKLLHGAPRAGQAGASMITHPGIDSIDMSAVKADLLGHTYFAANEGAIHDLFRLFWRGEPPPQRCGMNPDQSRTRFWSFKADDCKGADLLQASVLVKRFGRAARERVRARLAAIKDRDEDTTRQEWQRILERLNTLLAEDGT